MNSCEYYQELISRLIDGEISEEGRAVLARHLRECAECAAIYDAFIGISQAMGDDMREPPEELAANVMAEIRRSRIVEANSEKPAHKIKKQTDRKALPGSMKVLLSAAACFALVVAAAFTLPALKGKGAAMSLADNESTGAYEASAAKSADVDAQAGIAFNGNAVQAAPAEAAPAEEGVSAVGLEEAAETEAVVSNVYKVEILYAGETVEDFTLRIGEAPIRLTGKIYPISVKESPQWSSSDDSIISVTAADDGSCYVEAVGPGSAKVIAEYAGKSGECWVRVAADSSDAAAEGLEIHYAGSRIYEFTMHVGDANIPLKAQVDRELFSGEIIWSSSDENVIHVLDTDDGYCVVEAKDEGAATVILECEGKKAVCKVYVVELPKE